VSHRRGVDIVKKINVGPMNGQEQQGPRITVEVHVWWPEGHEVTAFDVLTDAAMEALQQIRSVPAQSRLSS